MRTSGVLTVSVTLLLLTPGAPAQNLSPAAADNTHAAAVNRLVATPAAELKWADMDPTGAPGVKIAPLWGDPATGAFGAYLRLPAGFAVPMHTHTHDMRVIFVSGTYIQQPDGRPEFRLGAGSYMMQPGGGYRHTTSCGKDADCVIFVESGGAFDLHVVQANAGE
jgi:anti-sigma factor ChrR (cupin superfamily)